MRTRPVFLATSAAGLLVVGAATLPATTASATEPHHATLTVLASHLDNPRGLAVQGDRVYIAESGHGDPTMCLSDPTNPTKPPTCIGLTGGISVVPAEAEHSTTAKRIVSGLISITDPSGIGSAGPSGVSLGEGKIQIIMAGNTQPVPPAVPPNFQSLRAKALAQLGQLIYASRNGHFKPVLGVGDLDFAWTAQHKNLVPTQFPDSNPNAVLAGDDVTYVVDAGANTLDTIRDGKITRRVFFDVPAGSPTDAVPTCVSRGPDGALYVGELLGGNFAPGHARVWRVSGSHKAVWATGLTAVNGCGWGEDGKFYATEFQTNGLTQGAGPTAGDVVQISASGKIQAHLGVGKLNVPSGFAADDGAIYVSNCSIAPSSGFGPCPTGGQLVRISFSERD